MNPPETARHPAARIRRSLRNSLLALIALPGLTSCVTEAQMRLAIEDRDREIATLRADKTELQERLDLLSYEKEDLRSKLEDAEGRLTSGLQVPASFGAGDAAPDGGYVAFPELEEMGITTNTRSGDTVISVPAEVSFASGKATLSANGRQALSRVASRLKSDFPAGARFYIEGHTDSDPISKSKFASNRELSIARAMAVLEYLVAEARVPDERFVVVGHGQYKPVAPNTKADKAKNRRVEIVVKNNG